MVRRQASKSRARARTRTSRSKTARRGVKKGGTSKAGAFLNFVRSMRDLFPGHTPERLKHDSKAIWREMDSEDKKMYDSYRNIQACGPGRMGRRRRPSRSRSRSRSRRRSRSRSRSRSRRRRRRRGPG